MADGDKNQGWPVVATIVTADAVETLLMAYTLGVDHTVKLRVSVLAQRYDSGEDDEVFSHTGTYLLNKSGAAAAVLRGSSTPEEIDPETTNWRVVVAASGNDAQVKVTGSAAEDVRWIGRIDSLDIEQTVAP